MDCPRSPPVQPPAPRGTSSKFCSPRELVGATARLLLLAAFARAFRLDAFPWIAFSIPCFVVHALLPSAARKPCLLLAFAGALPALFGIRDGLVVGGITALSLAWLVLRVPLGVRVGGLAATWAGLAALRAGGGDSVLPSATWGIVASLFVFRAIVYLYDLRHAKEPPSAVEVASYFCLLPNLFWSLFPVVDFKAFQRGERRESAGEVVRRGVFWMWRGALHLLLYRVVSNEGVLTAAGVGSPGELLRFLLCNYLLYLRVSGQFHLAVGSLLLFGRELPPTNRHWLLPSSFTDFWRRINIYWKDFTQKVFFYPSYFALRKRGTRRALVGATVVVFVATWALHGWQSFWIRGTFGFRVPDALFWGALGAFVLVGVLRESRPATARAASIPPIRKASLRVAKTAGTLGTILLLWALWTSDSVGSWLELLRFWN